MFYLKIGLGVVVLIVAFLAVRKFFKWIVLILVLTGLVAAYYYIHKHNINLISQSRQILKK